MSTTRYNVLIVDPDSASRGKLKQAALSLTAFHKVYSTSSLFEAQGKTNSYEVIDVVFISHRFEQQEIDEFVQYARQTPRGSQWAYCAVLKASQQRNEVLAGSVIGGIDGFLFEPFSADNLAEIAKLTAQVKLQNESKRKEAAMRVLLVELSGHIDAVAFYLKLGREPVTARKKLYEAADALKKFDKESSNIYLNAALEYFTTLDPPASFYSGVSKRVKEKIEKSVLRKLSKRYHSDK